MDLFKLVGSIFIDTEEANNSLAKTDKTAESTGSKLGEVAGKVGKVGAAVAGAGVAVGAAVLGMANKTSESSDEIDKMSQKLGMSREAYQEWDYVLGQAGVDINSMETGMKTLMNQIGKAQNGTKGAAENFEKLGISMDDISTMSREDIFAKVIEGFQNLEDSTDRAALANQMFGKSGQNLTALFNESSESTAQLTQKAHDLGLIMSDEAIQAGVDLHDTMDTLHRTFEMVGANLGTSLMPLVETFANLIIDFMPVVQQAMELLSPIIETLFNTLVPPLTNLVQMLFPILIDTILPTLLNLLDAVMPILAPIFALLEPLINLLMTLLTPLLDLINLILPPIIDLATIILTTVVEGIQEKVTSVLNFFQKLKSGIKTIFEQIVEFVKKPVNTVIGFINGLISGIVGGVNGVIRALNRFQINVPNWVTKLTGVETFGFHLGEVSAPQIPLLAKGADVEGQGSAIVGERGAELVELPRGARVTPLGDDAKLADKLDEMIKLLKQVVNMGVYIDGTALVGKLGGDIDRELGRIASRATRWA